MTAFPRETTTTAVASALGAIAGIVSVVASFSCYPFYFSSFSSSYLFPSPSSSHFAFSFSSPVSFSVSFSAIFSSMGFSFVKHSVVCVEPIALVPDANIVAESTIPGRAVVVTSSLKSTPTTMTVIATVTTSITAPKMIAAIDNTASVATAISEAIVSVAYDAMTVLNAAKATTGLAINNVSAIAAANALGLTLTAVVGSGTLGRGERQRLWLL